MTDLGLIGVCPGISPRVNLGKRWTSTNREDDFNRAFANAYNSYFCSIHKRTQRSKRIIALEVPVSGHGIADVVSISWNGNQGSFGTAGLLSGFDLTVRAFECKLSDWRRGLMQAYRYGFYSDAPILVLPIHKLHLAQKYMETFHSMNVGLWSFNEASGSIVAVFTPRPRQPRNSVYRDIAIQKVIASTR